MLKLSGEFFSNDSDSFNADKIHTVAKTIYEFKSQCNVDLVIVVGAGNVWRFRDNQHLDMSRNLSDKLGMTATNFNAVLLSEMLLNCGDKSVAMSCYTNDDLMLKYNTEAATNLLQMGHTIVLGGGTGNPFSTTDSAAVLRALELDCDVVFKATKVDGVYDSDPNKNPDAVRFEEISFQQALSLGLKVMDAAAFGMAMENELPILVFDFSKPNNLQSVFSDPSIGTLVS